MLRAQELPAEYLVEHARELRKNMTPAEKKLWSFLRTIKPRFLRQRPIWRIHCGLLRVLQPDWLSRLTVFRISRKRVRRETERTTKLEVLGPKVVRFTNDKVLEDFGGICPEITKLAGAEL